nr:MAG TPA: hypothetical protein [Crassvirales sp.]
MEETIALIIGMGLAIAGLTYTMICINKQEEKKFYIYPKTGHKYKILYECVMKLPIERTWVDAFVYVDLNDGQLYVREKQDFFNKFIKVTEWKEKKKHSN